MKNITLFISRIGYRTMSVSENDYSYLEDLARKGNDYEIRMFFFRYCNAKKKKK
jgi:hypothetical protein